MDSSRKISRPALLFLLTGPAGSGKTTLCDRMAAEIPSRIRRVVTSTTRRPRKNEIHGTDYFFFSKKEFEKKLKHGEFYETALVHGRYYGTLKVEIENKLSSGFDLFASIDVQGADSIRKIARSDSLLSKRLVTVFIMPRDIDQIRERLLHRGTDDEKEINLRLKTARSEILHSDAFDYQIPSSGRDHDFKCLREIYSVACEKARPLSSSS